MSEVRVLHSTGVPLTRDERALVDAQLAWVAEYDGYQRLAGDPEHLARILDAARAERRRSGRVPEWCGVDLLRGWAFYLYRDDYFTSGGHSLSHSDTELFREWNDVMAALTQHPHASGPDRPPGRPASSLMFSTEPRTHRDPSVLGAKQARLWEPHVAPVNELVRQIITEGQGEVPFVDPDSGGVTARVLLLLEAPARAAAHGSGMLSADNDDATAAHVWEAYRTSGLPREWGVHWNAVPWYVGKKEKIRAVTPAEVEAGRRWLISMLDLAPDLRVLLTMGVAARKAAAPLAADLDRRGITMVSTWHPSPRNYNSRPHSRPAVLEAFAEAYRIAGGT